MTCKVRTILARHAQVLQGTSGMNMARMEPKWCKWVPKATNGACRGAYGSKRGAHGFNKGVGKKEGCAHVFQGRLQC
jgi:hypothetical protein